MNFKNDSLASLNELLSFNFIQQAEFDRRVKKLNLKSDSEISQPIDLNQTTISQCSNETINNDSTCDNRYAPMRLNNHVAIVNVENSNSRKTRISLEGKQKTSPTTIAITPKQAKQQLKAERTRRRKQKKLSNSRQQQQQQQLNLNLPNSKTTTKPTPTITTNKRQPLKTNIRQNKKIVQKTVRKTICIKTRKNKKAAEIVQETPLTNQIDVEFSPYTFYKSKGL